MIEAREKWEQIPSRILSLNGEGSIPAIVKIVRALAGTLNLEVTSPDGTEEHSLKNNFIRPDREINSDRLGDILFYLFDEIPEEAELTRIFTRASALNRGFFEDLQSEVLYCLLCSKKERHTEAFLYLYRSLERISVALPLIYISRETDFKSAHDFLRGIFAENKAPGELGMLKSFMKAFAKNHELFRENSLDITVPDVYSDFGSNLLGQVASVIQPEVRALEIDQDTGVIKCPYREVASLIVSVRNRSFHNKSAQLNFDLAKLGGSEHLFSVFNPQILHWYSYLYLELARWQFEQVSRY